MIDPADALREFEAQAPGRARNIASDKEIDEDNTPVFLSLYLLFLCPLLSFPFLHFAQRESNGVARGLPW